MSVSKPLVLAVIALFNLETYVHMSCLSWVKLGSHKNQERVQTCRVEPETGLLRTLAVHINVMLGTYKFDCTIKSVPL